jgi:hypothetical protein
MKMIFGILVIAVGIYLGAILVPIYYANYSFADAIKTEATLQTYTTKPESEIQDTIVKKARELDIPIDKDHIKVHRTGQQGTGTLNIQAPYIVHVELPGYPLDLHFDPSTENKSPF